MIPDKFDRAATRSILSGLLLYGAALLWLSTGYDRSANKHMASIL
jgi:hypothetical protein